MECGARTLLGIGDVTLRYVGLQITVIAAVVVVKF